jgi:cobalt/nickel transport system permease protein
MHVRTAALSDPVGGAPLDDGRAAVRILTAAVLLGAGMTAPASHHLESALYLAAALLLTLVWGTGLRVMLKHLRRAAWFLAVFVALLVVFNWRAPFRTVAVGGVEFRVSAGALSFGLATVERAALAVALGSALFLSTGPSGLVAGLDRLRMPRAGATVLFLIFRYTGVLFREASRVRTGVASRRFRRGPMGVRTLALLSQRFLWRTFERSERVYIAMCSRGFDGSIPVLTRPGKGIREWVVGGALVVLVALAKVGSFIRQG